MTDTLQPRKAALSILHRIRMGEESDAALEKEFRAQSPEFSGRDRAFVMALALGTMRYKAVADALLAKIMTTPIDEKKAGFVADVLRMGAAQLLWLDVRGYAAVHSSVELVKCSKYKGFAKLVNGVLQRINREKNAFLADLDVPRLATPGWLWERWVKAYGEDGARAIAQANLKEPKLDLTVKGDPHGWAERLGGEVVPTGSVRLHDSGAITALEGFAQGAWWVQDASAAIPARLFGDLKGKRVLDLCAAPGGKTLQLASAGGNVLAVDRSAKRLERVKENLRRTGLAAETKVADALDWKPEERFDAILLDAPCTATGTLRRHPDVAWRKSEKDVAELAALQRRMLMRALDWLKPGGMLVYSTCSLEKEEGEGHIASMLDAGMQVVPVTAVEVGGLADLLTPEGYVRCLPSHLQDKGGMDGFFAVRLIRKR